MRHMDFSHDGFGVTIWVIQMLQEVVKGVSGIHRTPVLPLTGLCKRVVDVLKLLFGFVSIRV